MKITDFRINESDKVLQLCFESETQEESSKLIHACNHLKLPVKSYGTVGETKTWAWLSIPMKTEDYRLDYFGNDRDIVK